LPEKTNKESASWRIGAVEIHKPAWAAKWKTKDLLLVGAAVVFGLFLIVGQLSSESPTKHSNESGASVRSIPISTPTPTPERIPLLADIRYGVLDLTITNLSTAPWDGCFLMLNPGLVSMGYTKKLPDGLAPNTPTVIPLWEFTKGDKRFNPTEKAPDTLDIRCSVGGKSGVGLYSLSDGRGSRISD
jgi:hypothetical protein